MTWPDITNSVVEFAGGLVVWVNVRRIALDGRVSGASAIPVSFFAAWDVWHVIYYQAIGQILSGAACISSLIANIIWILLYVRVKCLRLTCH